MFFQTPNHSFSITWLGFPLHPPSPLSPLLLPSQTPPFPSGESQAISLVQKSVSLKTNLHTILPSKAKGSSFCYLCSHAQRFLALVNPSFALLLCLLHLPAFMLSFPAPNPSFCPSSFLSVTHACRC